MRGLDHGWRRDPALTHARQHSHAVEVGHDQIENDQIDRGSVRRLQPGETRRARFGCFDFIAKSPRHGLQEPTLHGVIVDDQDQGGHENSVWRGPEDRFAA